MSRRFFCSECGMELALRRKALRNRQAIIDLIFPHTCDPVHLGNIKDADKPVDPTLMFAQQAPPPDEETRPHMPDFNFIDKRDQKFLRTQAISSAPTNLIKTIKGASESEE